MGAFDQILKKIDELGGVNSFLSLGEGEDLQERTKSIRVIEDIFGASLPGTYKRLIGKFGAFSFNRTISIKCIEHCGGGNAIPVVFFFGFKKGNYSVLNQYIEMKNEFENIFLPICDAFAGNFVCLNLSKQNYGKIFYFNHEAFEGEEFSLVENSFESFMANLEVEVEEDFAEESNIHDEKEKLKITPELLKMLKDSGLDPQNYELI